ncbi:MAG: enhanced serine sensitivity protein SseB C-terminal domain-containing protein [Clostridiales bacterium]|nr:enhanced serine sensitivity protein SseB C-terminal domain-containing protein [Clostridiales bacterium]
MSDKDKNIFDLEGDALDEALMAAIEQTDEEEREARELKAKENQERAEQARITAIEQEQKKAKIEELRKNLPNEGRRYFLMAEESECDEQKNEASVTGIVYGTCKKDDSVFLYRNDGKALGSKVISVEKYNGQVYEPADEVSQGKARITISIDFKKSGLTADNAVPKFAVVTSVRPPVKGADGKTAIENPSLSGLMFRYPEYKTDKEYLNHLTTNIVNGQFLIPAMNNGGQEQDGGKKKIQLIMFTKKEEPDKRLMPLFTDIQALYLWRKVFEGEQKPSIVVMNFVEVAKFIQKEGLDLAINPAGPISVGLPAKAATQLASLAQKMAASGKVKKENITDGSKVTVGQPHPGPETDAVRQVLVDYCKGNRDIKKAGLLFMIRNNKMSYLVIVDVPKGKEQPVYSGLLAAMKPHLKSIKNVDFSLYAEAPFAKDYFAKIPADYQA